MRAIANGLKFELFNGIADHFIRRGHNSRISKHSEVKTEHLLQRKKLFRDTVELLKTTNNWNKRRRDLMIRRYVILAIQMHRTGQTDLAENTLQDMKKAVDTGRQKNTAIRRYFRFETSSFYRSSTAGGLLRPLVKQYHRIRLGDCVIQSVK